jgi:hypothetical protein
LEHTRLTKENVLALYRFSLLLNGEEEAARRSLLEMLSECAPQLAQLRSDTSRLALALKKLRAHCLKNGAPQRGTDPVSGFAGPFSALPDPGRSALALLYLKVFSPGDTAALLGLTLEDFSAALQNARALLRESQPDLRDSTSRP